MSRGPARFGREVLGPIVAEFCLQLWSLGVLMERPDEAAMLFCARGGLRLHLAYERFLAATALRSPLSVAPLMVSRVAAVRPALVRGLDERVDDLLPAAASTLSYEFARSSLAGVARAVSGVEPVGPQWTAPFRTKDLVALFRHTDGGPVVDELTRQAALLDRHLRETLRGRRHAVLVDTGLYGTTRELLAEGLPGITFSSALMARSYRPGLPVRGSRTFGLSVEATDYSPWRRRTAMLRYWHFIEWLFEPDLPSVRSFVVDGGSVRSNLQVEVWRDRIEPGPGSAAAGVFAYIDALPRGSGAQIVADADRAWAEFRRAVVWPNRDHGRALEIGSRSHDFGTDATWTQRPWSGALGALRGSSMWREGEIARSGTALRVPLLLAIEAAYTVRHAKRSIARRNRS